ncbi:MAG: Hsp33 family molecular chaperone HslO [Gammaproteobacteria bacterium]|nr:Hsp33 family molecular chaperone HslO [Gammaproteobacteria bacterium]
MPEKDQLHRFLIENTNVRGEHIHLDATWQAILQRTDYPEQVQTILGEALAACALLTATIKFDGSLILQIRGDGPLHLLVVQATADGTMRAIARWQGVVPERDLKAIFGNGQMAITIEPDKGEPYQGIIALQGNHLNQALEAYFEQSEQLNTRLWLCASAQSCAGLLLQELPGKNPDTDAWNRTTHLASTITDNELLNLDSRQLLHRLFHEEDIRLFESEPFCFRCNCSRERISNMLLSLGIEEAQSILNEHKNIEVNCEFCNALYSFDKIDVDAIFNHAIPPETPNTKH